MSEVNYEIAWRFLKKLVGQFKKTRANNAADKAANSCSQYFSKGGENMARIILEEMECMEEGIAEFIRGEKADE